MVEPDLAGQNIYTFGYKYDRITVILLMVILLRLFFYFKIVKCESIYWCCFYRFYNKYTFLI